MLSAVKLYHWVSISGPSATVKPRSAKISASSSITWLTGWTVPWTLSGAGSDRSSVSVASLRSSSAASSAAFRWRCAALTCSRSAWIFGASAARVVRVHRAKRFQLRGDLARFAERRHAHGFELGQGAGGGDRSSRRRPWSRPLAMPRCKMQRRGNHERLARAQRRARPRDSALLHLAAQMLGKIRVAHAPWTNHGWHVALQPHADGLKTLPTAASDGRTFTLMLDLCRHAIVLWVSDGSRDELPLNAGSVAALHRAAGRDARPPRPAIDVQWHAERDRRRGAVRRGHGAARLRPRFRRPVSRSTGGDASGVRAFPRRLHRQGEPGALLVGQLRSRRHPLLGPHGAEHPGGMPGLPDRITREAYSQEEASVGFWAAARPRPNLSSTATPTLSRRAIASANPTAGSTRPLASSCCPMRTCARRTIPAAMLGEFLQSTYAAAADLAHWDRAALEREPVAP